ncbi:hypothetical protein QBC35DRAFT_493061 [Podospora australis]|uniref:Transcription factor tau subunit sfc4 n=1 Tax=Podospora australis TaxID=1536484 RepID=A0AAN7AK31_9PEZI|nr:hypothetical protein QBC35DRAFT_493061 [Podospora australis]
MNGLGLGGLLGGLLGGGSGGAGGNFLSNIDPSLLPPDEQQQQQQQHVEDIHMGDADEDHYDEDGDEDDSASDISADSDAMELRAELDRFDQQQEAFVAKQRAEANGIPYQPQSRSAAARGGGRSNNKPTVGLGGIRLPRGRKKKPRKTKGPRKAIEPPPEIKYMLSQASARFQTEDYSGAMAMLSEVIRVNSEVIGAWTLLSAVHEVLGNKEEAVWCKITASHLAPRDVPQWVHTAEYALEGVEDMEEGPEKEQALKRAYACYTQALDTDRTHIEARTGRADVIMMQGNASKALQEYQKALGYRPWNIRTVRNIADVALDVKDTRKSAEIAKQAYRRLIDHLMEVNSFEAEEGRFEWSDLRIYLEFFGTLEQWAEGLHELKEVSRWLLGRREEEFWERFTEDDREWDTDDNRRIELEEFQPGRFPFESYGHGMPIDLRAKMFVYRCKLGFEQEAELHLSLLNPETPDAFQNFPDCLKDIAVALLDQNKAEEALRYLELYKQIMEGLGEAATDADFMVCQGRYHMVLGNKMAAEECFIAAIEDDEDHIEARVQLANMYEGEQEQEGREEAFLLVHEAMNLEARREATGVKRRRGPYAPRKPGGPRKPRKPRDPNKKSRYVPRRLINAEKRKQQEIEMTAEAAKNYQKLRELEGAALLGDNEAKSGWMKAAQDLVDDFRSYKQFYPWDKYIKFLGYATTDSTGGQSAVPARNFKLAAMEERLRQNLAPVEGQEPGAKVAIKLPQEHRGIPFSTWLDIFLNYAFSLVHAGKHREAYLVCHAARDSVVWTSTENTFLIHVAWASCAVYAGDEETCVAIARYFMRDYMPGTDSYRMFSAMCRVCQTPVSWYTSGPAQKFILRQIKTMDNIVMKSRMPGADPSVTPDIGLDVCLLTIYGHILFTTTSYTYALSYFARAASIDPHNCLINLSTGLAYIHYALKRQATNRQYLLAQGFAFLFRYHGDRIRESADKPAQRQEAHFNIARAYSLIGLGNLAVEYYRKVLEEGENVDKGGVMGNEDLTVEAAYNIRSICYFLGDVEGSKAVTEKWMVLE